MHEVECGRVPSEVEAVAQSEGKTVEYVMRGVARGTIVIPHNVKRQEIEVKGIGEGLSIKINANVGTSPDFINIAEEVEKAKIAVKYGADTIMDLSIGGDVNEVRRQIIKAVRVPIGTVPIYQAGIEAAVKRGQIMDMDSDDMFNAIRKHAEDGVDFVTVHCGITKSVIETLRHSRRLIDMVSRGGSFNAAWILEHGKENPLYGEFDYLLELAREYDLTLSLGDGMRPGCLADGSDSVQFQELLIISKLVERAREMKVQSMVEGPGHLPLDQVDANVKIEKNVCKNAPFYVLGPIVTDIAPCYDHLVGAIGGAVAGMAGADYLCYVTPAEHISLPMVEDVKQGVIASKIAAHVANIVRGLEGKRDWEMGKARKQLDWKKQFELAIDPKGAMEFRRKRPPTIDPETCSMCSKNCAIKFLAEKIGR